MDNVPLVTVLIATYNYEKYIGEAIDSIVRQNYLLEKIEVIVVDDGSKDNTAAIIDDYKEKLNISYFYQENQGKAAATYKGIQQAAGEYLFVLDADDYYLPDCIDTVITIFKSDATILQVSHLAYRLDEATGISTPQQCTHSEINKSINGRYLLRKNIFKGYNIGMGSTFAARTEELKKLSIPPDIDMYIDFYLFIMMAAAGNIVQLDKLLSVFRRHNKSYSEGADKSESKKKRSLRYLKSAHALYIECSKGPYDKEVKQYLKFFYYQHLLAAIKFTDASKLKVKSEFIFMTLNLVWYFKKKARFLLNNLKLIAR